MKRILIICLFFLSAFGLLCFVSCTCNCDAELETEEKTLTGCHIDNSCVDCYWFPGACGKFPNDFSNNAYYVGCSPQSCVVCGFDCTLLECYQQPSEEGNDVETRSVVTAVEGVDYRIDKITFRVDNEIVELDDGDLSIDDIQLLIELLNLKEAVAVHFYVEYTAYTELHSVDLYCDFDYNVIGENLNNFRDSVHAKRGNIGEYYGQDNYRSKNLKPGKHMIYATVSFNAYELLALEGFSNFSFSAYTYGGVE